MKLLSKEYKDNSLRLTFNTDKGDSSSVFRAECVDRYGPLLCSCEVENNQLYLIIPFRKDRSTNIRVIVFENDEMKYQFRAQLYRYSEHVSDNTAESELHNNETQGSSQVSAEKQPEAVENKAVLSHDILFNLHDISSKAIQLISEVDTYAAD